MKAVICDGIGAASVMRWTEVPMLAEPNQGSGDVLLRVAAAGVNRPDILQRKGLYQPPTDASAILGLEVAGEIVAGDVQGSGFQIGDRVCALTHGGGYAEYVRVPVKHCLPIPNAWSIIEAASLPETFFTVWFNVFEKAHLGRKRTETLLVHAGASGIGVAAIQMACAMGQTVYVSARSAAKRQACLDLGARYAFDTTDKRWVDDLVKRGGVDVILDMLAADTMMANIKTLNIAGRLVCIAFLTGAQVQLNMAEVMAKEITITGSFLRPQSNDVKAAIAQRLRQEIWPHLNTGRIRPAVDRTFAIQDACLAHQYLESGDSIGKVVLTIIH